MSWYAGQALSSFFFFLTSFILSGLYGFDVKGFDVLPSLQIHYWSEVLRILRREIGADVLVTRVPPYDHPLGPILASFIHDNSHRTGAVVERATRLHEYLKENASGCTINLIGHSMVGLSPLAGLFP
jgi:triacylglycerol lipase